MFPTAINDVHIPGADTAYLVYQGGDIFSTQDRGANWTQETAFLPCGNCDAQFFDPLLAYAAGGSPQTGETLIRTTNGGMWWNSMAPAGTPTGLFHTAMEFINANTGFVGSQQGQVLRTWDGGLSWDSLHGVLVGDSIKTVLFTQDDGQNWMDSDVPQPRFDLSDVHFGNATEGYAIGKEKVLKTTNAGTNWQRVADLPNVAQSFDVFFTDGNTGFVTAKLDGTPHTGAILRSSDGGQSWNQQFSYSFADSNHNLVRIYFPDALTGYAIDEGAKLFKSQDGGMTWNEVFYNLPPFGSGPFSELYFATADTGYIANAFGIIYTEDGGLNWTNQFSVPIGLGQISVPSSSKGYIGGFEWLFYSSKPQFCPCRRAAKHPKKLLVYPQPA